MQEDNKISGDTTVSDPVRVAAAKLLNEHSVQLLHLKIWLMVANSVNLFCRER